MLPGILAAVMPPPSPAEVVVSTSRKIFWQGYRQSILVGKEPHRLGRQVEGTCLRAQGRLLARRTTSHQGEAQCCQAVYPRISATCLESHRCPASHPHLLSRAALALHLSRPWVRDAAHLSLVVCLVQHHLLGLLSRRSDQACRSKTYTAMRQTPSLRSKRPHWRSILTSSTLRPVALGSQARLSWVQMASSSQTAHHSISH